MIFLERVVMFFIFALVLFVYLHIQHHLKKTNDLETYDLDNNETKERFEEICDFRQPTLFHWLNPIQVNWKKDYAPFDVGSSGESLPLQSFLNSNAISFSNEEFLKETGIMKSLQAEDDFLRPFMTSMRQYDIVIAGGNDLCTSFEFSHAYRHYISPIDDEITILLAPPKNIKFAHIEYDYEHFRFTSPIKPFDLKKENEKMKFMKITVKSTQALYIPAYWLYSVKFTKASAYISYKYHTYMSQLSIFPQYCIHFLQLQNINFRIAKRHIEKECEPARQKEIKKNKSEELGQKESGQMESRQKESGQKESRQKESGQMESGQKESEQKKLGQKEERRKEKKETKKETKTKKE